MEPAEREQIKAAFRAVASEPVPPNRKPIGCTMLFLVPPLLILGQYLPQRAAPAGAAVTALVALLGGYLALFGSSREMSALTTRGQNALSLLAHQFKTLSPEERRVAAVRALAYARHTGGPVSFDLYDAKKEAGRLGEALPYVREVERVLVEEGLVHPVFTDGP